MEMIIILITIVISSFDMTFVALLLLLLVLLLLLPPPTIIGTIYAVPRISQEILNTSMRWHHFMDENEAETG